VLGAHDVFSVEDGEKGHSYEDEIITGDSLPVKQQARRVSFALKEKFKNMVVEMVG